MTTPSGTSVQAAPATLTLTAPAGTATALSINRAVPVTLTVLEPTVRTQPGWVRVLVSGAPAFGTIRFFLDNQGAAFHTANAGAFGSAQVDVPIDGVTVGTHQLTATADTHGHTVEGFTGRPKPGVYPSYPSNTTEMALYFDPSQVVPLPIEAHKTPVDDTSLPEDTARRYTGLVLFDTPGRWEVAFDSDDAGELYIADALVSAHYAGRSLTTDGTFPNIAAVDVTGSGWYRFTLLVQNTTGAGGARLGYRSPSQIAAAAPVSLVPLSMLTISDTQSFYVAVAPAPPPAFDPEVILPPPVDTQGINRWAFQAYDYGAVDSRTTYIFPVNPDSIDMAYGDFPLTDEPTVVSNGQVITWEGAPKPVLWRWTGRLLTEPDVREMRAWGVTGQRIWLTDHFQRRYLIKVADYTVTRVRDVERNWHHEYQMSAWVLRGDWVITQ